MSRCIHRSHLPEPTCSMLAPSRHQRLPSRSVTRRQASAAPSCRCPGGEQGYGGDFRRRQVVPVQAGRTPLWFAFDDLVGSDDEVDAEVVLGLGNGLVYHLERVDGCHDHRAGTDPSGLLEQCYLDIGITPALP